MRIVLLLLAIALSTALADDRQPASGTAAGATPAGRTKSLDFDGEVIEGMNKNPLDSLTRVGKNDDKDQSRLYQRKPHFKREIRQTVREMEFAQ
jgi:hypothetical protein